jgi:hypothetical protein
MVQAGMPKGFSTGGADQRPGHALRGRFEYAVEIEAKEAAYTILLIGENVTAAAGATDAQEAGNATFPFPKLVLY